MSNAMQTLDQKIADKVGAELIDLIDPGQWRELVKQQIDYFLTNKAPAEIQRQLHEKLKQDVAGVFAAPEWQPQWDAACEELASTALQELMIKTAPEMFTSMFAPVVQNMITDLRYRLQNGG